MDRKTQVDLSPYIVNVQGKDFITFPGLLAEAHAQGLIAIETNLINQDLNNPVVKANVVLKDDNSPQKVKSFTGYGDANSNNVAKKVAGALLRMAETRAVARALRFACNIDMTALEEIGVDDDDTTRPAKAVAVTTPKLSVPTAKVEKKEEVVEQTQVQQNKETSSTTQAKITFNRRPKTEPNFP